MKNIMLDLETLGTSTSACILSIGAVEFDEQWLGKTFHTHISPESCVEAGLVIEPRTVFWWMEQDEQARLNLIEARRTHLRGALANFIDAFEWEGKRIWCNGASFDFPILKSALDFHKFNTPWMYWNEMDMRTLKNLAPKDLQVPAEVKHDALSDAVAQAKTVQNILRWMSGGQNDGK